MRTWPQETGPGSGRGAEAHNTLAYEARKAAREGRLTRPLILQPTETQKANTTP